MKKLKLCVEDLKVSSFEIADTDEIKGTVLGAEVTGDCSYTCTDPFSGLWRYLRRISARDCAA